jgi:hypothetical protein
VSLGVRVPETETRRSDPSRSATKDAPAAGGAILSEKMAKARIATEPWRQSTAPLHAAAKIGLTGPPRKLCKNYEHRSGVTFTTDQSIVAPKSDEL